MSRTVRIATRTSQLARWQAEEVARQLLALEAGLTAEFVLIESDADMKNDQGFEHFGYKGVFTKRIEAALLDGRADIAVHSMKDVHSELPKGLHIAAMLPREDPRDAFISNRFASLEEMPAGSRVGTASIRREAVIRRHFPHLEVVPFRGNVPTRLKKLERGDVDGTLLALAGLKRLNLESHARVLMPAELMLPAVAQGAIGIEAAVNDDELNALLAHLNHLPTFCTVSAERAMLAAIDGDCHTPLCGIAQLSGERLQLQGRWIAPDGSAQYEVRDEATATDAKALGMRAGEALKRQMDA